MRFSPHLDGTESMLQSCHVICGWLRLIMAAVLEPLVLVSPVCLGTARM